MKDVPKDMRTYYVAFLVAGPKFAPDSPARGKLMPEHLAFIRRMISEKKVRLAGPFADEGKLFGIAIVDASSAEEARAWMEKDRRCRPASSTTRSTRRCSRASSRSTSGTDTRDRQCVGACGRGGPRWRLSRDLAVSESFPEH